MQPHRDAAAPVAGLQLFNNFLQRHSRAVVNFAVPGSVFKERRIDQRPGIDNHTGAPKDIGGPDCNQVCRPGAGSNKINHFFLPPSFSAVQAEKIVMGFCDTIILLFPTALLLLTVN